jgi:hypothetical protein
MVKVAFKINGGDISLSPYVLEYFFFVPEGLELKVHERRFGR